MLGVHSVSTRISISILDNPNKHITILKLYCDGYHIGKNRDNKTDYDKKVITDVEVKDKTLIFK